jgi:hypothetical protein
LTRMGMTDGADPDTMRRRGAQCGRVERSSGRNRGAKYSLHCVARAGGRVTSLS